MSKCVFRERSFRVLLAVLIISPLLPASISGQTSAGIPVATEDFAKSDANAYTMLFRRVIKYQEMAQAAKSDDEPAAHLTSVLPQRLKLSSFDAANLQRFAKEWAAEQVPLRMQVRTTIDQHHAAWAERGLNNIPNPAPTVALRALQDQRNAVTLRYRDMWQNTMRPAEFSRVQTDIRKMFDTTGSSPSLQSHTGGGAK